jgi:4-amino-4-deoxy-L-arabinose transferase-like glycosyltransferase
MSNKIHDDLSWRGPAWLPVALAFGVAAYMIFANLGAIPLLNPDEGRNASVAAEMQASGNWLVPTYDGLAYLDKPAFFFKAVALSLWAFGHDEFAARLPSALFALGLLGLVFGFCRREYGALTASLAVAVVSTTPLFFTFARYVIFDMTLALFVCAAIFAGYYAETKDGAEQRRWYLGMAASIGLAMLVKGPVGVILPLLVLGLFNAIDGRKDAIKRMLSWQNILVFLAIFLPWFVGVSMQRHDFPYYGAIKESVLRFTTNEFHRSEPFWFYLPVILATFLFWSLMLPESLLGLWRRRRLLPRADRLLIVWIGVVTVFFSLSQSKLAGYVLTAVIALGILAAHVFADAFRDEKGDAARIVRNGAFMLAACHAVAAASLIVFYMHPELLVARISLQDGAMDGIHAVAMKLAAILVFTVLLCIVGIVRRNARVLFSAFLLLPLFVPVMVVPLFAGAQQHRADRTLAGQLASIPAETTIACIHCFPAGLPFYLNRTVTVLTDENGGEIKSNYIQFTLSSSQNWPPQIVPITEADKWIATQAKPVFLMAGPDGSRALEAVASARHTHTEKLANGYSGLLLTPGQGH